MPICVTLCIAARAFQLRVVVPACAGVTVWPWIHACMLCDVCGFPSGVSVILRVPPPSCPPAPRACLDRLPLLSTHPLAVTAPTSGDPVVFYLQLYRDGAAADGLPGHHSPAHREKRLYALCAHGRGMYIVCEHACVRCVRAPPTTQCSFCY